MLIAVIVQYDILANKYTDRNCTVIIRVLLMINVALDIYRSSFEADDKELICQELQWKSGGFFQPPGEAKIGLKNRLVRKIGGKIDSVRLKRGKQLLARVIGSFEKSRGREIRISLYIALSEIFCYS